MHKNFVRFDEPISIRLKVETHQYPKHLERWVTQSDLGLVVNYQNQFAPEFSLRRSWLLQAKRVFPSSGGNSYDRYSAFPSRDSEQEKRMRYLRDWAGEDFIRFLLYCPRPKTLGQPVRETLNQLRTNALSRNIFDYAFGLQLRDDLLSENPTVAAGMFVAPLDHCPSNLGDVHQSLFNQTIPFAWFMIEHLTSGVSHGCGVHHPGGEDRPSSSRTRDIERLVRGDHRVLEGFDLPESLSSDTPPRVLPVYTVEVEVTCGLERPNRRNQG